MAGAVVLGGGRRGDRGGDAEMEVGTGCASGVVRTAMVMRVGF
jgi:hypothetical protein